MSTIFDFIVRFRTWIANVATAIIVVLPLILNTPEFQAVVPDKWLPWLLLANVALNIWMRPRPASRARDFEVQVKNAVKNDAAKVTINPVDGRRATVVLETDGKV